MTPVHEPIEQLLSCFLHHKRARAAAVDARLTDVVDEIAALVTAGGKRLRPAFVYWGYRAAGGVEERAVVHPAAAIELLHTFALIHDDVMDGADHRRGRHSAHRSFAEGHRRSGARGDSRSFGVGAAVLAGDLTNVWADELLGAAPLTCPQRAAVRAVYDRLRNEVIAGQFLDLLEAASPGCDEQAARKIALLKSARYTVTRPLELGMALVEDVCGDVRDGLARYGDAVGLAFQLRDDVLGLVGDPAVSGKGNLDDLRSGKRTLPVLTSLRLGSSAEREIITAAMGDGGLDDARAATVRTAIRATGALDLIESAIDDHLAAASDALDCVPEPARTALEELGRRAARRRQ